MLQKIFFKLLSSLLLFLVAFVLFLAAVAWFFGFEQKHLPAGVFNTELPLTAPLEWNPNNPPTMLARSDFPGLKESRDHRYTDDPYFVFRNYKNYRGHLKMTLDDKIIFSVPANTDEFGRRCNESRCKPQKSKCGQIGLFISSKIFGYGVADDQSVPARLKAEAPNWAVYNYGIFTGHYVQFYLLLKSGELKKHLGDAPTLFVFFWEADAFSRTIPTLESAGVFYRSHFYKSTETEHLEYDGDLAYHYPIRNWLTWLISSMNFFLTKFPEFSFFTNAEKMDDFIQIQKEIQYEIGRQFKDSRYVLASINYGEAAKSVELLNQMNKELNLPFIQVDVTDYIKLQRDQGTVVDFMPYDSHPTPVIYEEAARRLKEKLKPFVNSLAQSDQCKL